MKSFIRNLPLWAEVCLVIGISLGLQIVQNVVAVAHRLALPVAPHGLPVVSITDRSALRLVLYEVVVLAVVFLIARVRGWSFTAFGLRLSWKLAGIGFALVIFIHVPAVLMLRDSIAVFKGSIGLPSLVLLCLINAFFEEALEVGYIFRAMNRHRMLWPIIASALLRSSLHLYAGMTAFAAVLVGGIIYGLVYWKWRQLWPLVLAHSLADSLVLWSLVRDVG